MTPAEGIAALECALESGQAQVTAAVVDWDRLRSRRAGEAGQSLLSDVLGVVAAPTTPAGPGLRQRLVEAPAARRAPLLAAHVAARVTRVLGLAEGSLDLRRPLNELGLDSLMAVELRNQLKVDLQLGVPLTATLVFDHPTVEAIADFLVRDALALTPALEPAATDTTPVDAIGHIEQLSDDEVDRLFAARLREPGA
jgi:acyl carrier protein